jgi:hypothetical protein
MDVGNLWLLILLGTLVVLVVIAVVQLGRIVSLLKAAAKVPVTRPEEPAVRDLGELKQAERVRNRHFEEFLAEDPSREEMSKSEQSAAFRQWRQDRGFTWGR